MNRPSPDFLLGLTVLGGLLYPLLVYFGMASTPPIVFTGIALALIGARFFGLRHRPRIRFFNGIFAAGVLGLIALSLLNASLGVKAYPVLVSLVIASFFGLSLIYPPSLVEQIARLTEPDLPPGGVIYTRKVTIVWLIFLLANACISAATALFGNLAQWTLWNGLLSYILMGILFMGEWIFRSRFRRISGGS